MPELPAPTMQTFEALAIAGNLPHWLYGQIAARHLAEALGE